MHVDWTLGENLSSFHSFLGTTHFFCLKKGLSLAWVPQSDYTDCLASPQGSPGFSFLVLITSTQHSRFFSFLFFFFRWILGIRLWFSHLWDQHFIDQTISLVRHFFCDQRMNQMTFFPHFPLRELEGRCFQIVIMELKARLLGRLNLVTFVIFPNARISIITQTHVHSCTHTLTHALISIKEAEKCHQ